MRSPTCFFCSAGEVVFVHVVHDVAVLVDAAVLLHDHGDVLRREAVGVRRDAFREEMRRGVSRSTVLIVVALVVAPPNGR
jgi:hypothetical protein